ncbi:hypothetical protein QJS66_14845 [Kocuria rhizophila]|nr:hypothetical protein QJS66_14845 [Kocuria rhizophila]
MLRNHRGERLMLGADPRAGAGAAGRGGPGDRRRTGARPGAHAVLDCTAVPVPDGLTRGSTWPVASPRSRPGTSRDRGIDWSREPVPASPAAHYLMGGSPPTPPDAPRSRAVGRGRVRGHGTARCQAGWRPKWLLEAVVFGERVGRLVAAAPADPCVLAGVRSA